MKTFAYSTLPTLAQWQKDSNSTFAIRKKDEILVRIDTLLQVCQEKPEKLSVILSDLYFTVDYWLKIYQRNTSMEKDRQPAVYALYKVVVEMMCKVYQCSVNGLPRELELMYGREMSAYGTKVDLTNGMAKYLERKDAALYQLKFRGGRAYQYTWWDKTGARKLVLAESKHAFNDHRLASTIKSGQNYGAFTLTMSRDLYMNFHCSGKKDSHEGIYHSSYVAGQPVMAAGTMLVEHGIIKRVRSDSGHYRPIDNNMLALLQTLQMFSIDLTNVIVEDFKGETEAKAPEFFKAQANWSKLVEGRNQTLVKNMDEHDRKPGQDLSKRPNTRDLWHMPPTVKGNPFEQKYLS